VPLCVVVGPLPPGKDHSLALGPRLLRCPSPLTPRPYSSPCVPAAVKAAGKWRQEGKMYEVQDGDIIHWWVWNAWLGSHSCEAEAREDGVRLV